MLKSIAKININYETKGLIYIKRLSQRVVFCWIFWHLAGAMYAENGGRQVLIDVANGCSIFP